MARAGTYAARRQLRVDVVELVAAGASVTDAAARLGIRVDYAARLLHDGIAALPAQDVDDLRTVTELRLDRLAKTYGDLLDDEDAKVRLAGANGLRQVEADRARLLGTWQKPPKDED
jgi:hypothetical protein